VNRVEHLSDSVTLHLGDCREILPTLGKVDAVVSDPPYVIAAVGGGMGAKRKYLADINGHIDSGFDPALLRGRENWFVFCGKPQILKLAAEAETQGLRWQLLTWNKTNPTPLSNGNYLPDTEYMVHAFRTHRWEGKSRFIVGPVERGDFDHPTVKPMYVMERSLRCASRSGDLILDPFMGSGTTGVACVRLGRRFTGIKIEPRYFDIACRRIADELKRPRLDLAPPPAPKQEALEL
jgi:DNA modification methylase